jgi:L-amino acid N-acyltransferase YncA
MSAMTIRRATLDDLPAVREIFNHYVATTACTFQIAPETEAERRAWFGERTDAHPATVAEAGGEVVGWAAISPWKGRCAYRHSVEASVYVRHDRHRRGVGRALMLDLIERARAAGHHTVLGGACTEQEGSLALQRALGFEPVACFRQVGHKFGRWLDVAYLQLML